MNNSVKGANGLEGNNIILKSGECEKNIKTINDVAPITVSESEVDEMNKELGVTSHTRVTARWLTTIVKAVNYLKVRF